MNDDDAIEPRSGMNNPNDREALYFAGGAALIILGAGLLMTNPALRKLAKGVVGRVMPDLQNPLEKGLSGLIPDMERYMKIRSM